MLLNILKISIVIFLFCSNQSVKGAHSVIRRAVPTLVKKTLKSQPLPLKGTIVASSLGENGAIDHKVINTMDHFEEETDDGYIKSPDNNNNSNMHIHTSFSKQPHDMDVLGFSVSEVLDEKQQPILSDSGAPFGDLTIQTQTDVLIASSPNNPAGMRLRAKRIDARLIPSPPHLPSKSNQQGFLLYSQNWPIEDRFGSRLSLWRLAMSLTDEGELDGVLSSRFSYLAIGGTDAVIRALRKLNLNTHSSLQSNRHRTQAMLTLSQEILRLAENESHPEAPKSVILVDF